MKAAAMMRQKAKPMHLGLIPLIYVVASLTGGLVLPRIDVIYGRC